MEEGGGSTSTYPWETWRYRYLEGAGLGNNVILEFVDPSGSGEYHLTMDPSEKDALLHVPGAGLSLMESMGMASKADRFTRSDGTNLPTTLGGQPASMNEFSRLEQYAKIQQAPPVKFKDLEALVTSRIVRDQVHFAWRTDFLKVTSDTVLVPVTVQVPNSQLTFQSKDGVHTATMNVFGRVSTLTGRVVQTFEEPISKDFPDSLFQQSVKLQSIYQKAVPLRPGLYRLDLVIKDVQSGNVGVVNARLQVPRYEDEKLEASSLILADQIERVPAKQIGAGQFVIGSSKVRPRLEGDFTQQDRLGIYMQVYNLKPDEQTHKSSATFLYTVKKSGEKADQPAVMQFKESSSDMDDIYVYLRARADGAMPSGGILEVRTNTHNGSVEIEVVDTGAGIPREHIHRIFDPFFTTKASGRGTGLGLSVSYGIIKEHAGKVDVRSAPGKGTSFHVELPAVRKPVHV